MLSIANTNSTAKIVLFPEEKENKSTKRMFLQKLSSDCMVLRKIEMDLRIFFHKISGIL